MELPQNDTRQRILDIAEELFSRRGYASVTLRDIANALGMKHASLYYYAPEGKKQLFVEVMERNFQRHKQGLTDAIIHADGDLRQQMYAVARWLVSQPPIDFSRMVESDMSEISRAQAEQLITLAYDSIRSPLVAALKQAHNNGKITMRNYDLAAMALISLIQSIHMIPSQVVGNRREKIGLELVDMLMDGWL
jgi:AcrR family transcriptional regulator